MNRPVISTAADGTPIIDTGVGPTLFLEKDGNGRSVWIAIQDRLTLMEVQGCGESQVIATSPEDIDATIAALELAKEAWFK